MLFEPERHEALEVFPWNEAQAREAIERIARAAAREMTDAGLWSVHPEDAMGPATQPACSLYWGAAGVMWGLEFLHAAGAAPAPPDFTRTRAGLLEANRRLLRPFVPQTGSWLMGDSSILALEWKRTRSPELAAQLAAVIAGNQEHPSLELMLGAPGTMLAALTLHAETGEARWAELFRAGAAALWQALARDTASGQLLWTQELWGSRSQQLGAVHGFAGNAAVLIRGRELLAPDDWSRWQRCIVETLAGTALREDGLATWPPLVGAPRPGRTALLVQHCHGAPGVVTSLASLPDASLDALLLAGGELVWRAGPLTKGANLCHGTAGNGYAFLKLFRRSGDARWLERARSFAMHAIAQCERQRAAFGRGRHSLWTGDIGTAVYLESCIRADDAFPTVDFF